MLTSSLAGRFAPGIRGTDFLNEEKYPYESAAEIFATDRAAFLPADSRIYSDVSNLNAVKAESCIIIPVKTVNPEASSKILARGLYTIYVNADMPDDVQQKAIDFVRWYSKYCATQNDVLEKSVRSYFDSGDVLAFDEPATKLENFAQNVYKDEAVRTLLANPMWNAEKLTEFTFTLELEWDVSKG
jgi:hypothetical protein